MSRQPKSSPNKSQRQPRTSETKKNSKVFTVPAEEMLALGIGNVEDLNVEQLRRFFEIVNGEPASKQKQSLKVLQKKATHYLFKVKPHQLLKNAQMMSSNVNKIDDKYRNLVQQKIQEYTSQLSNIRDTVDQAVTKFDNILLQTDLSADKKQRFERCHNELVKFHKQLEKTKLLANKTTKQKLVSFLKKKSTWKKAAAGIASAYLLKKLVLDSHVVQKWIHSKVPKLTEWQPTIEFHKLVDKISGGQLTKLDDFLQQRPNCGEETKPAECFKSWIKNASSEERKQLTGATSTKNPNFITDMLKNTSESTKNIWVKVLKYIKPSIPTYKYDPWVIQNAKPEQINAEIQKFIKLFNNDLIPKIKKFGVIRLINLFRTVAKTTTDKTEEKAALVNVMFLKWWRTIPFSLVREIATKSNIADYDVKYDYLAVKNWIYTSPIIQCTKPELCQVFASKKTEFLTNLEDKKSWEEADKWYKFKVDVLKPKNDS
jgi:hypothetical protein